MTVDPSTHNLASVLEDLAHGFGVLAAPMRLHIISCLCHGEKNVSELLANVPTTQPNLSQHLSTLYKAGFVSKRRQGNQIYYTLADARIVRVCQIMCGQG